MKKISNISIIFLLLMAVLQGCSDREMIYLALDNNLPDSNPKVFADHILNLDSAYVGNCTFNKNENQFIYAITTQQWNRSKILRINSEKKIDTLKLNQGGVNEKWVGEPRFSPDGSRMYFTSIIPPTSKLDWHADLFYIEKEGDKWSEPKEFEANSKMSEWHLSFTKDNIAYFGSDRDASKMKADIFYSKIENGKYKEAIKLPSTINTEYNDCDPLIAPDQSYVIYHSDRPGGYGEHDLYISFRTGENKWTEAVNMGESINTPSWEFGPTLSVDGKYLFFSRRESMYTEKPSKIYWVDISIIEKLN